jgi:hypothetical protein
MSWYEQQGWEAMNKNDTTFINRHTTKGAQVGRHPKEGTRKRKAAELEEKHEPVLYKAKTSGRIDKKWFAYLGQQRRVDFPLVGCKAAGTQ